MQILLSIVGGSTPLPFLLQCIPQWLPVWRIMLRALLCRNEPRCDCFPDEIPAPPELVSCRPECAQKMQVRRHELHARTADSRCAAGRSPCAAAHMAAPCTACSGLCTPLCVFSPALGRAYGPPQKCTSDQGQWGMLLKAAAVVSWMLGCVQSWIDEMATHLKQEDPNHLVTVGEEGFWAVGSAYEVSNPGNGWAAITGQNFTANHASKAIDFAGIHVWPDNWEVGCGPQQPSASFSGPCSKLGTNDGAVSSRCCHQMLNHMRHAATGLPSLFAVASDTDGQRVRRPTTSPS